MVRTTTVLWISLCLSLGYFVIGPLTEHFVMPKLKYYINNQIEEHLAADSLNIPAPAPKEVYLDGYNLNRQPAP